MAAIVAAVYTPIAIRLIETPTALAYQPFAWMVPLFAAYVAWTTRADVRRAAGPGRTSGLVVAGAGVVTAATAAWFGHLSIGVASFVFTVSGLIAARWGWRAVRSLAFPLGFLLVIAPLPAALVPPLSLALQRLAAATAEGLLRLAHVPIVRDDVFLHFDGITLEIAEPCNGLRFLLTMVVVAPAVAWALGTRRSRALAVVGLGVLAGVLANLVRVGSTALLVHALGLWTAVTRLHEISGKGVYVVVMFVFVLAACRVSGLSWSAIARTCRAALTPWAAPRRDVALSMTDDDRVTVHARS